MSAHKLVLKYSARIVQRQWRRFVLPFFSLAITATVLTLILLTTQAGSLFLDEQSRTLLGGDVVIETAQEFDSATFWKDADITPDTQSNQISFSATLKSTSASAPFQVKAVDQFFPLYGEVLVQDGTFATPNDTEIYLDAAGAAELNVQVGDTLSFGDREYRVAGIIEADPTQLFGGFRFFPQAVMSLGGFAQSGVNPDLLRAEYSYAAAFTSLSNTTIEQITLLKETADSNIDIDIAGQDQRGLQFGLTTVSGFLTIAVLVTAVLAAVNVYASTLYFVTAERKNLAVLLALGLCKRTLTQILGASLMYIVVLACACGIALANILFSVLSSYIASNFAIVLPHPQAFVYSMICFGLIVILVAASFIPSIARTLRLNPKQILIGTGDEEGEKTKVSSLVWISLFTVLPLTIFASFLLQSITYGVLSIVGIAVIYISVAATFSFALSFIYKRRAKFSFFTRSIIAQKKADGFFGSISFTSLFVALVAIGSLALIQLSLEKYLTNDLAGTVPSTYVLDVQPSQKDELEAAFPELTLFENIRARIVSIDELQVQEELSKPESTLDRELGREFNLTARNTLLSSEEVTEGTWSNGAKGELSVDEDFAQQANIRIGSTIVFSIQGFPVQGTVTSFRKTDSRSGLPFFYFVLSPEDVAAFPAVYFGYSFADAQTQDALGQFVAQEMPNISVIDTQTLGEQVVSLVRTLLIIVFSITLPPLLIATLLITTLVVSSYESRRREGARLRALGATRRFVLTQYLTETVSLTLFAALISYILSMLISFFITTYYLQITSPVLFDLELIVGLGLIVLCIGLTGLYLFKKDTMPLRELISYETNV